MRRRAQQRPRAIGGATRARRARERRGARRHDLLHRPHPASPPLRPRPRPLQGAGGILVASYPVGTLLGAVPGGVLASRLGVRPAVVIGLAAMSVASLVFGYAHSLGLLDAARFVQGIAGACTWAGGLAWLGGRRHRRAPGAALGTAFAAAVGGALLGPVIGAVASHVGTGPAFAAATVAGGTLMVASRPRPQTACRDLARALRSALPAISEPAIAVGMWLTFLAGLALGVVDVLGPAAAQPAGCRARWSSPGSSWARPRVEIVLAPLVGRLADRRGRMVPVRLSLMAAIIVAVLAPWLRPLAGARRPPRRRAARLRDAVRAGRHDDRRRRRASAAASRPGLRARATWPGRRDRGSRRPPAARSPRRPSTPSPTSCWRRRWRPPCVVLRRRGDRHDQEEICEVPTGRAHPPPLHAGARPRRVPAFLRRGPRLRAGSGHGRGPRRLLLRLPADAARATRRGARPGAARGPALRGDPRRSTGGASWSSASGPRAPSSCASPPPTTPARPASSARPWWRTPAATPSSSRPTSRPGAALTG